MTASPNPLARLVGELPKLRERPSVNAKQDAVQDAVNLYLTWKSNEALNGGNLHLLMQRVYDRIIEDASPSAHAIAIEAIERLERVEKAAQKVIDSAMIMDPMNPVHPQSAVSSRRIDDLRAVLATSKGEGND